VENGQAGEVKKGQVGEVKDGQAGKVENNRGYIGLYIQLDIIIITYPRNIYIRSNKIAFGKSANYYIV